MSRRYCLNNKKWINKLPYCSYYNNVLCKDVKDCPAHYDDDEDDIGKTFYDEGDALLTILKGIITEMKEVIEVTEDGKTRKVTLLTLDNGINLKDCPQTFTEVLQKSKQLKRMLKFTVDADDGIIDSISYY